MDVVDDLAPDVFFSSPPRAPLDSFPRIRFFVLYAKSGTSCPVSVFSCHRQLQLRIENLKTENRKWTRSSSLLVWEHAFARTRSPRRNHSCQFRTDRSWIGRSAHCRPTSSESWWWSITWPNKLRS